MLVVCNVFSRIYYLRLSSHILSVLPHFTKKFSSRKCCCYDLKVSIFQFPLYADPPTICHTIYMSCVTTLFEFEMYIISCLAGKNEREKSSRPPSFGSYKRFSIAVGRKDQRDPQNLAFDHGSKMGGLSQCVHS